MGRKQKPSLSAPTGLCHRKDPDNFGRLSFHENRCSTRIPEMRQFLPKRRPSPQGHTDAIIWYESVVDFIQQRLVTYDCT